MTRKKKTKELRIFRDLEAGDEFFDVDTGEKFIKTLIVEVKHPEIVNDHHMEFVNCLCLADFRPACAFFKEAVHVEV